MTTPIWRRKGFLPPAAYAAIAPSVPHALHMPSHIFARAGMWREMIESNRASYQAARNELSGATMDVGTYDALHAMDYLVFCELQSWPRTRPPGKSWTKLPRSGR